MGLDITRLSFCLTLLIYGVSITKAAFQNFTIDDTYGDEVTHVIPAYLPAGRNAIGNNSPWAGPECTGCRIQPDPKQTYNGTWHAATYHPEIDSISIQFPFTGCAIYVFFIIPHTEEYITTNVACNFSIDGGPISTFYRNPTDPNGTVYNYPAFIQTGLDNVAHTMKIETGNGFDHSVFIAFDYAIYTYDDSAGPLPSTDVASTFLPSSTSSPYSTQTAGSATSAGGSVVSTSPTSSNAASPKHDNTAAIIAGVVGGVVGFIVLLLGLLFLACSRRRRSSSSPEMRPKITPSAYYVGHGPALGTAATDIVPSHYRNDKQSHPNMSSAAMTSKTASLTRQYDQMGTSRTQQTTDELKRARQRELQRQLEAVNAEMRALQTDLQDSEGGVGAITERNVSVRSQTRERNDQEVLNLREQIRVMSEQMETLRLQQDSAWAQGLSDEPPPGYTPHVSES